MKYPLVKALKEVSYDVARKLQVSERNRSGVTFAPSQWIPLSEIAAVVIFDRSDGKKAMAVAWWNDMVEGGKWFYLAPKDGHVLAMQEVYRWLQWTERHNIEVTLKQVEESVA